MGLPFGFVREEVIDLGHGAVKGHDGEAVVGRVQDQILAHDGQTNEAEISTGRRTRRPADIDAGETRAIVSPEVKTGRSGGANEDTHTALSAIVAATWVNRLDATPRQRWVKGKGERERAKGESMGAMGGGMEAKGAMVETTKSTGG